MNNQTLIINEQLTKEHINEIRQMKGDITLLVPGSIYPSVLMSFVLKKRIIKDGKIIFIKQN